MIRTIRNLVRKANESLDQREFEQWGYRAIPEWEHQAAILLSAIDIRDVQESEMPGLIKSIENTASRFRDKTLVNVFGLRINVACTTSVSVTKG